MSAQAAAWPQSFAWWEYGEDVMAGRVPVCRWTRLAVERHYRDLETGEARGLWFCDKSAQYALESFLYLKHVKGAFKGQQFVPAPWQQFWLALAFGWKRWDEKGSRRRFREVWLEVPRKCGKTTLMAGVGLYMLEHDGEGGPEVYAAATKKDQAKILFEAASNMVQASPLLRHRLRQRVNEIYTTTSGRAGTFRPLGRDSSTLDGLNPHCALLDEVHAHPNSGIYDVVKTGMGARLQPMIWQITTAGYDLQGFGFAQHEYAQNVLNGTLSDDDFLAVIYTVDDPDRWDDPVEWAKANPNLGVSLEVDELERTVARAKRQTRNMPAVKTKRLNIWLQSGSHWIDVETWRACGDASLRLEDFAGEECWIGIDLAEKRDIAAVAFVFRREGKYYALFKLYHNEEQINAPENRHFFEWERAGHLVMSPGNATDFDLIRQDLRAARDLVDVQEVVYDPKFAAYFAQRLADDDGLLMVEMAQTSNRFTLPIVSIENLVLTGDLVHDANPAVAWMVGNVVMRESKFSGLRHPTKERPENKIDAPVALIMAASRAMNEEADADTVHQGFVVMD